MLLAYLFYCKTRTFCGKVITNTRTKKNKNQRFHRPKVCSSETERAQFFIPNLATPKRFSDVLSFFSHFYKTIRYSSENINIMIATQYFFRNIFMHFCPGTMTTHAESINSDLQCGLDKYLRHTHNIEHRTEPVSH